MFYLLCFGDNCFTVFDFDEQAQAESCAEKWVSEERFYRCVVCQYLSESLYKE